MTKEEKAKQNGKRPSLGFPVVDELYGIIFNEEDMNKILPKNITKPIKPLIITGTNGQIESSKYINIFKNER